MNTTRDQDRPLKGLLGALALVLALLSPGCRVNHPPRQTTAGMGDENLLRRASDALLDRIRIEQEHVDFYKRELTLLRVEERRLSGEFVQKEAEYQLLASDRDGQIQEAAEAQQEYQAALNSRVELESLLAGVRQQAAALELERADLQDSMQAQRGATDKGKLRLAAGRARLAEIQAREASLAEELAAGRAHVEAQSAELTAVQAELAQLKRSLIERQGTREWLRSSLLASLFTSSLRRDAELAPEAEPRGGSPAAAGQLTEGAGAGASGNLDGTNGAPEGASRAESEEPGQVEGEASAGADEGGAEDTSG